ncbi:MAG: carboxylating nicotinate-nucleotide diphosphorylase [Pseudomonadota bacterium]
MLNPLALQDLIDRALEEDLGFGDLTGLSLDADATATFALNARQEMVLAGVEVAVQVFRTVVPRTNIAVEAHDGDRLGVGAPILTVSGTARGLLTAERTALNFLQHLSGIATLTAAYVAAIEGTGCTLLDTRKTTPGLRMLEKHAVTCGGGRNHRLALDDGIMLKDNHIAVAGSIPAAIARARMVAPALSRVEVECDRIDQVREALDGGADMLMLDNMDPAAMREAVALVNGRVPLEASGGVTLETIRAIAETGVTYVSVGRITQSAPAVDIGMDAISRP